MSTLGRSALVLPIAGGFIQTCKPLSISTSFGALFITHNHRTMPGKHSKLFTHSFEIVKSFRS